MENILKLLSCFSRFYKVIFQLQTKYSSQLASLLQYNNLLVFLKLPLFHQNYPHLKVNLLLGLLNFSYHQHLADNFKNQKAFSLLAKSLYFLLLYKIFYAACYLSGPVPCLGSSTHLTKSCMVTSELFENSTDLFQPNISSRVGLKCLVVTKEH